jgi:hypothetical protein
MAPYHAKEEIGRACLITLENGLGQGVKAFVLTNLLAGH